MNSHLINKEDNEIWKDIPGYEGLYQASSLGRIKTIGDKHKSIIMKGRGNNPKTGSRVGLWKVFLVARLIGMTFLEMPITSGKDRGSEITINHKDGNRLNNELSNLEWLTLADNIRHAFRTGLMPHLRPVILIDDKTGEHYEFNSMSEASRWLGRVDGYLSTAIKKGHCIWGTNRRSYSVGILDEG